MKLSFGPWPGSGSPAREAEFVELLENQFKDASLASLAENSGEKDRHVHFLVIDVTPAAQDPEGLEAELRALLTGALSEVRSQIGGLERQLNAPSRVLFVGATPGIDSSEDEKGERVSRKKAVEFYIRALQSAGLAHYGSVIERGAALAFPLSGPLALWWHSNKAARDAADGLAQSAIIGLARHYGLVNKVESFGERCDVMAASVRELLEFARILDPHLIGDRGNPSTGDEGLIEEIGGFFQLGKRDRTKAMGRLAKMAKKRRDEPPSSYAAWRQLEESLRRWGGAPQAERERDLLAEPVAQSSSELMRYQLLRDLGRCIGSGATAYLGGSAPTPARARARGILVIDDTLASGDGDGASLEPLRALLGHIGWAENAAVASSAAFAGARESADLIREDQLLAQGFEVRMLATETTAVRTIDSFALVLAEVESPEAALGPKLIQRLRSLVATSKERDKPPIIVLTRTESIGHIQQSLNLGAVAYVLKERMLQLPFQMKRALEAVERRRDETRQASFFRKLNALRPERRARLRRDVGLSFVHGGLWSPNGQLVVDRREESLIRDLPKADLHCHFGTCISYPAIRALALNSTRYMLPVDLESEETPSVALVIRRATAAVVLADWIRERTELHPMLALALGAGAVSERTPPRMLPGFGLGNAVIRWLRNDSENVQSFEVASVLVAAICAGGGESVASAAEEADGGLRPERPADYFAHVGRALMGADNPGGDKAKAALALAADAVAQGLRDVAGSWKGRSTRTRVENAFLSFSADPEIWDDFAAVFGTRLAEADGRLRRQREETWSWLRDGQPIAGLERRGVLDALDKLVKDWHMVDFLPSGRACLLGDLGQGPAPDEEAPPATRLDDYVRIPAEGEPDPGCRKGLQRYLRGADLLGADHLQYPENLLLAAFAFVLDNARDNVIYSEVRCETPGYCHGGMDPYGATDLLCRGLDLASLVVSCGSGHSLPLVRTNLLIAAKRHKDEGAARDAVTLLTHYLHRRRLGPKASSFAGLLPEWWGPCHPAGFDVSGDESATPDWLERIFEPLARLSSPITIHAGEAASAASIWEAVYRNNATRIGHGLRLREDDALLRYCVNEGICMEMCPNSNLFTNRFERRNDDRYPPPSDPRGAYPLLEYMRSGLEVAVSTDNRYLHPERLQTLTGEYLTAARLSNGLTRWEILQLVKASFKNAFLPKKEVQALLSAMEERVYRITARGWF
ncbi:MAG TPA: hypothetical protein VF605_09390 [Allosphingosinicella sp.]|jgi:adenosine deaminase/CheY-like chemotaxis protein